MTDASQARTALSAAARWTLLGAVSLGVLLISVDMTVLYTALPTLTADLGASASERLWIINAYPLVMAGLLLGSGALGDRFGHKRMFLIGLVVFGAASIAAAYAPAAGVLIAARALLAVGAAAMMPATLSLIRITFDDARERGIAIGVWGAMAVCGSALGPIVGGLLLEFFWWGSVFLINVPLVLLALVVTVVVAPASSGSAGTPWDLLSSVQVMVGLAGLVFLIKEATAPEPGPLVLAAAAAAALAGLVAFTRRQRRLAHPLVDFALLRDPVILIGVVGAAVAMFIIAGAQLLITQRLQLVEGYSPLGAGVLVTALAVGALPAGMGTGSVLHRTGERRVMSAGLLTATLGAAVLLWGATQGSVWTALGLAVVGFGTGMVMTAASAAIVGRAPAHRAGMASSVEEVSYELGSLSGVAVLGSLLTSLYTRTIDLPAGAPAGSADSLDQALINADSLDGTAGDALAGAAMEAFDTGFQATLAVAAVLLGAGYLFAALYKRKDRASHEPPVSVGH